MTIARVRKCEKLSGSPVGNVANTKPQKSPVGVDPVTRPGRQRLFFLRLLLGGVPTRPPGQRAIFEVTFGGVQLFGNPARPNPIFFW
jgi:hypothetical protein